MRQGLILVGLLAGLAVGSASAFAYDGDCLLTGEKMKPCQIEVEESLLSVRFSNPKDQKWDRDITGDQITKITAGQNVHKETMKTMVLGPLMFFTLFGKDAGNRDAFAVEYRDSESKPQTIFIRLKKKDGYVFGTSLRKISGREIQRK